MKTIKKLLCALFALVMIAAAGCSCGKTDEKHILVASYDGGKIYSDDPDLTNWTNYLYTYYAEYITNGSMNRAQFTDIVLNTVVLHRVEELDMEKRGLKYTEEDITSAAEFFVLNAEQFYEGGYEKFLEDRHLTTDFVNSYAKVQVMEELILDDIVAKQDYSDAALLDYFHQHIDTYVIKAGYSYDAAFLAVTDFADDDEVASKKAELQGYIDRIVAGEKFSDVKKELLSKYSGGAYDEAATFSGEGIVEISELVHAQTEKDLEDARAFAESKYPNADAKSEKDSDAYGNYLRYLSLMMKYEQCFALLNTSEGETFSKPILSPIGWMMIKNLGYNPEVIVPEFADVKDRVKSDYTDEFYDSDDLLKDYKTDVFQKYNVKIEDVVLVD